MATAPPPNAMIDRISHYRLTSRLGKGAMGEVYRAVDERLGRAVALKLLSRARAENAEMQARLLREAQAASALNHPGIVTVHDIGAWHGQVFMVMSTGSPTTTTRSSPSICRAASAAGSPTRPVGTTPRRSRPTDAPSRTCTPPTRGASCGSCPSTATASLRSRWASRPPSPRGWAPSRGGVADGGAIAVWDGDLWLAEGDFR